MPINGHKLAIKWVAKKNGENLWNERETKGFAADSGDEQCNLQNFAGCEISQPTKFHRF